MNIRDIKEIHQPVEYHQLLGSLHAFQEKTFPSTSPMPKLHHLVQEVDELMEAIEKKNSDLDIRMEFADCFQLLFGAASKYGLSSQQVLDDINTKHQINKKRKWGKPDANGVVNHIEEEIEQLQ